MIRGAPFTMARTRWTLGYRRLAETLWAWLIWEPDCGPFPQISHRVAGMNLSPFRRK